MSVPALGPVWRGGHSILAQDLTHRTSGKKDAAGNSREKYWPAFDDAFDEGEPIIAPEPLIVIPNPDTGALWSTSHPGKAFYAQGDSLIRYWFAHLDRQQPVLTKFRRGALVGKVAENHIGGGPHTHVAVNIERLIRKNAYLQHHTNYTHGATLIGVQLRQLLMPPGTSTKDMWAWIKWYRGREEYEQYGPKSPEHRPNVPPKIPAAWWARLVVNLGGG